MFGDTFTFFPASEVCSLQNVATRPWFFNYFSFVLILVPKSRRYCSFLFPRVPIANLLKESPSR